MSSIDRVAPYVEQLLENRDVRADIQRAASKARQAYGGARAKKPKRKVLADKRIRRRVRDSAMAARDAVLDLRQTREAELRKQRRRRRVRLVLLGTLAGAAMVAANERMRSRLASQLGIGADASQAPPETTRAMDQDAPAGGSAVSGIGGSSGERPPEEIRDEVDRTRQQIGDTP